MTPQIIWRNPMPQDQGGRSVERVTADERVAVYAVSQRDAKQNFELIAGGVA